MTLRLRSCEVIPALLVAGAGLLSAIAAVALLQVPSGPALWGGVALQTAASALLLFIRQAPFAMSMAVFAVSALLVAPWPFLDGPTSAFYGTVDQWVPPALIGVGVTTLPDLRGRRAVLAFAALALVTVLAMRPWQPSLTYLAVGLLRTGAPTLIGLYVTARRRLVQALRERAERAEREQLLIAERTRAEERTRMAAEMHDVVTHRLSLMVLQAGALRMTALNEATRRAAEELRSNGHQALEELRDLIGLLRAGASPGAAAAAPLSPAEVPSLEALAAESESVGVPVELVEEGDPALVSPVVARTAYRVLQEALTNVRKHAPGSRVQVRVTRRTDGMGLSVVNTAPTSPPDPALASSGGGAGLLGLRHQVELVGGTLSAGPAADGGFQVTAALPAFVPTGAPPPAAAEAVTPA